MDSKLQLQQAKLKHAQEETGATGTLNCASTQYGAHGSVQLVSPCLLERISPLLTRLLLFSHQQFTHVLLPQLVGDAECKVTLLAILCSLAHKPVSMTCR